MKRKVSLLFLLILCMVFAGCSTKSGEAENETSPEAEVPEQEEPEKIAAVIGENEKPEQPEKIETPEKKEEFRNDFLSFSYNSDNFTVEENEVGVGVYTKIPDNGGHNTILVFMTQENPEFDSVQESDIRQYKKMVCEEICKGLLEIDDGTEMLKESFDNENGYFIELSDGTKCYARIMSYGRQLSLAISRLCPYSDAVNVELLDIYASAESTVKEELPEIKTPSARDSNNKEVEPSKVKKDDVQQDDTTKTKDKVSENNTVNATEVSSVTIGQANALSKARDYLDFAAFSYTGLIEQLKYEKFTTEEATYAADNCGADWNEQAVKKAKEYLGFMSFSKEGLIDQLIFDGFSREQAIHGVEANGL